MSHTHTINMHNETTPKQRFLRCVLQMFQRVQEMSFNSVFHLLGWWRRSKPSHTPFMQICKQQLMRNVRKGKHHFYSLSSSSSVFGNAWMQNKTQKWPQDSVVCSHACDYCVAELTEDHKRMLHFGGTPSPSPPPLWEQPSVSWRS